MFTACRLKPENFILNMAIIEASGTTAVEAVQTQNDLPHLQAARFLS